MSNKDSKEMELSSEACNKFKKFMQDGHANNGLDRTQLVYGLFMQLGEEEYQSQSFLEEVSDFIDTLSKKLDEKWNNKGLIPFQNDCVSYLFEEGMREMKEFKDRCNSNPQLKETSQDHLLRDVLNQINLYDRNLLELDQKHKKHKGTQLFYAFLQIAAIEDFLLTRHSFSKKETVSGEKSYQYICCPTKKHYEIKPQETIRIFIRSDSWEEGDSFYGNLARDLGKLEPKSGKVFLFTLNKNLPSDLFEEGADFNLQFVTTKSIKNKYYANNDKVRTLEELIYLCKAITAFGQSFEFSESEIREIQQLLKQKRKNYDKFKFLKNFYQEYMYAFTLDIPEEGEEDTSPSQEYSCEQDNTFVENAYQEKGVCFKCGGAYPCFTCAKKSVNTGNKSSKEVEYIPTSELAGKLSSIQNINQLNKSSKEKEYTPISEFVDKFLIKN